jgi:uncharacterized protein with beta-barrel porin domain
MNKAHRVIWSSSRCALIVTDEHGKTRGKPSSTRKALATAIVLGLSSLLATPYALAASSCAAGGANTINGPVTATCVLASGGTLQITPQGQIVASGPGVLLLDTGNGLPPIRTSALISNAGVISANEGVLLSNVSASGALVNTASGKITPTTGNGISVRGSVLGGAISNAGTLTSPALGIQVDNSLLRGDLTNSNLVSGTTAVSVTDSSLGTLRNTGTIRGQGTGSTGVLVRGSTLGGNLDNQKIVTGFYGLRVDGGSTINGSILNKGNIVGQWYALAVDQSHVLGDINLQGSASGGADGVAITGSTVDGSLLTRGTVFGRDVGIHVIDSDIAGSFSNSNAVTGGKVALQVQDSTLGSFSNSATLKGATGIAVSGTSIAGALTNSGTINATTGLTVSKSTITGELNNSGSITQVGEQALLVSDSQIGKLTNSGLLQGATLQNSTLKNGLVNSGTLAGIIYQQGNGQFVGHAGLRIADSTLGGGLLNNGTVSALYTGNALELSNTKVNGALVNAGTITTDHTGMLLSASSIADNLINTGTVEAMTGLDLNHTSVGGSLVNQGRITGNSSSLTVRNGSSVAGDLVNKGTLAGYSAGVIVSGSTLGGAIINDGTVQGPITVSGQSVLGHGVRNTGSVTTKGSAALSITDSTVREDGITNTKALTGELGGVNIINSTVTGGINNSGTMGATDSFYQSGVNGLTLKNSTLNGNLVNSGSLDGNSGLVATDSLIRGSLINSGMSSGGFAQGIALYRSRIEGSLINTAGGRFYGRFGALVVAESTITGQLINAGIGEGRTSTLSVSNSTISGGVTNSGTLTAFEGGNGISGSTMASFLNTGLIRGIGTGIYFGNDTITGDVTNAGTINGMAFSGVDIGGTLNNSGSMTTNGTGPLEIAGNSRVNGVLNTGTLTNDGANGVPGAAITLKDSTIGQGGLVNRGLIGGEQGLSVTGSTVLGNLVNGSTGTLSALTGVTLDSTRINGHFINDGKIQTAAGVILRNGTVLAGDLVNNGTLDAVGGAVRVTGSSIGGAIVNNGTLQGPITLSGESVLGKGVRNTGVVTTVGSAGMTITDSTIQSGGISNTHQLTGARGGVNIVNSTVNGGIANSGDMSTTDFFSSSGVNGVTLDNSTVRGGVTNSGTMGGHDGFVAGHSTIVGNIVNSGIVSGGFGQGIGLNVSRLEGSLINSASGSLYGRFGALSVSDSTITGQLLNAGLAEGRGTALDVRNSVIGGGITNSGTINSAENSNQVSGSTIGSFLNTGRMRGIGSGVYFFNDRVSGNLINAGTMNGMVLSNVAVGGVVSNSGDMSANLYGPLDIEGGSVVGGIVNTGSLVNSGANGNLGPAVTVKGSTLGQVGFLNSGSISGDQGVSVAGSTALGDINNSGSIVATTTALHISDSVLDGRVINSGILSGGQYALLSENASVTRLAIAGNNTAVFSGEVRAPEAQVTLGRSATYTLQDGNLFTVKGFDNSGTLRLSSNARATIDGNYTQAGSGVLSTQAVDANTFGKLKVTGTATLPDQARFNVDVVNSGQSFNGAVLNDVLSAGTLNSNGTYAVTSNSTLFNFSGSKDGNSVDLVATPKSATAVSQAVQGSNANRSAARALDSALASNSSLTPFFVGATNGSQVGSAISQTLPSNAVAASEVSQSTLSTITDVVQSRIDANTGLASGDGFYGDKNLWMKPFGSWINQSERGSSPGYDASVYGMAFGVDAPVNERLRLGVSFSYANADTNSKADLASQSAKVDLYQLMGYGSYTVAPNTELSFHAGVGQNRNDAERNINLNGIGGKASANYDSRSVTAGVALAKAFDVNPTTRFIPSVRADYTWLKDDSYHETGNAALQPLLLEVGKRQTDQLILGLDGKVSHEILAGTQVTANLGVGYDVIHDDSMLTSTFAGAPGQSFNTDGQSSSPWLARGGVGLSTRIASNGTELSVNYDAEARTDFTNQTVSMKLKMPF